MKKITNIQGSAPARRASDVQGHRSRRRPPGREIHEYQALQRRLRRSPPLGPIAVSHGRLRQRLPSASFKPCVKYVLRGEVLATHASALKAHRQSLVHRERNRKYRSQLRSTLKQIRPFRREGQGGGEERADFGYLADRQDGRQGHHPSQHGEPLQVAAQRAVRENAAYGYRSNFLHKFQLNSNELEPYRPTFRTTPPPAVPATPADRPQTS